MGHIKLPWLLIYGFQKYSIKIRITAWYLPKSRRVLYFAQYIVTSINNDEKLDAINFFKQIWTKNWRSKEKFRSIMESKEFEKELEILDKSKKSELKDPEKLESILKLKVKN